MLIDSASGLPDLIEADVCVIGAGAAGITLALALEEAGVDTVVLEGGGTDPTADSARYGGDVDGLDYAELHVTRLRGLGGTTGHWSGFCAELTPFDLAGSGYRAPWPISHDELAARYPEAGRICDVPLDVGFDLADWTDAELWDLDPGVVRRTLFMLSPPRRFGEAYRDDLAAAAAVRVITGADVTALIAGSDGEVAEVRVVTDGGDSAVRARQVVLACGALENTRMLLAARDDDVDGVAASSALIGRGFHEHPHLPVAQGWFEPHPSLDAMPGPQDHAEHGLWWPCLSLGQDVRQADGLLDVSVTFARSDDDRQRAMDALEGRDTSRGVQAIARDLLGLSATEPVELFGRTEQLADPDSSVTLTRDRDAVGVPRIALDWRVSRASREAIRDSTEVLLAELARAGGARLRSLVHDTDAWPAIGYGNHPMGTTRMGTDAEDGVADADCRVFGVPNLWLTGSGLFCTGGYANPTLTVVALALRLADTLAEEVGT